VFVANACRRTELGEYCQLELFHAACASGHVVVMTSAVYGRMRLGRCVKQDYGFIGCSADVLRYADRLCSGRQTCQFPVAQLHGSQPCPDDLTPYLEASYQCVPGKHMLSRGGLSVCEKVEVKSVRSKAQLNHHNHLGAENSLFVPQFLGTEKLGRQCE